MTDATQNQISYGPSAAPPRRPDVGVVISWIAIVACIALIIALNRLSTDKRQSESQDTLEPNVSLEITGRYAVATNALALRAADKSGSAAPTAIYLAQLDNAAKNAPDRLRVAIVAGALDGTAAALQRIEALRSELHSPQLEADAEALRYIYDSNTAGLTAKARQRLIDRYGWFGHLALAGHSARERALAMDGAWRAAIAIFVVGGFAFVALLGGLVLLIVALVRLADEKLFLAYVPVVTNTGPFLEGFAIYLAMMIAVSSLVGRYSGHLTLGFAYLLASCLPIICGVAWPLLRGASWSQLRYGMGWHLGTGLFREMFWGAVGYIAGLPLLAAGAMVTFVLMKISGAQAAHPIVDQAAGLPSALRLFLLASVFAPLAEESLFRGALFHHLRQRHRWWISTAVVSLIFAAIHPQGWAAIPPLAMIAVTLAAIREWRGTFIASVTAHAINNGAIMLVLVMATS